MPSALALVAWVTFPLAALQAAMTVGDKPVLLIDTLRPDAIDHIPMPPIRFQGDVNATVFFVEPGRLTELCGGGVHDKIVLGCATASPKQMAVPNPCKFSTELYARILCHELGHLQLWPADHGD